MTMRTRSALAVAVALTLGAKAIPEADAAIIPVMASDETLQVALPAAGVAPGATLQFELDGYDIAAVVQVAADVVSIPVATLGLTPGEHTLRILVAQDNGDLDTLADHTLDVYQREGVRAAAQEWNVLLGSQYRVAQHPDDTFEGAGRGSNTALAEWQGDYDRGTWIAGGVIQAIYDSNRAAGSGESRWQLPALDLRAGRRFESGHVALGLGDDELLPDNLVFSGFVRRGLRIEASALHERLNAQTFTLHTDPVTSFDARLAPYDTGASVVGAHADFAPFARHPDALTLSASWLDGDSDLGGVGILMPEADFEMPLTVGGSAWAVALDSFSLGRSLWLHGAYARSRFDADGEPYGEPARDDDARRAVVQLASGGALSTAMLDQWSIGYEHRRVGPHFFSLGNLMLPGDLDLRQMHASFATHGFGLEMQALDQFTDVDDDPLRPRVDSDQQRIFLSYTPSTVDPAAGPWKWLGVPSVSAGYEATANTQRASDLLIVGYDLDNRQRAVSGDLSFTHTRFTLGLNAQRIERDDRSRALIVDDFLLYAPAPDSRETLWGLSLGWNVGERFTLAPQWQRSRLRDVPDGAATDNDLWSLQVQANLIPDVLSVQLGWSESNDAQRFFELPQDRQRLSSNSGTLDISYRMRTPNAFWPGIHWYLRGAYGRNALNTPAFAQAESQWQAQLSFELNWQKAP
jgi:hypothetical protein